MSPNSNWVVQFHCHLQLKKEKFSFVIYETLYFTSFSFRSDTAGSMTPFDFYLQSLLSSIYEFDQDSINMSHHETTMPIT